VLEHIEFHPEDVLLSRLRATLGEREVVVLAGSGLTMPLPGIPGVPGTAGIVEMIHAELGGDEVARQALERALATADNPYQTAFGTLNTFRGTSVVNRLIRKAVLAARRPGSLSPPDAVLDAAHKEHHAACKELEGDTEGWVMSPGVEALGRLAARHPRFGQTILTTNFDPLIEVAIARAQGHRHWLDMGRDGSLGQTHGEGSRVVHLHGHWYGALTLHTPAQLQKPRPKLEASLRRLLDRDCVLLVLAYSGWDDVLTRALAAVLRDVEAKPEVLWTFYKNDVTRISQESEKLLRDLVSSTGRVTLFRGIDVHGFLPHLADALVPAPLNAPGAPSIGVSPAAVGKTRSAPLDPLAHKLEEILKRKQRLEAEGLPTDDILAELRELKREHRRGGQLRPGDVLGDRYLLAEQIGHGGFATVWRARDSASREDVAIKVLHPNLAGDTNRRQRFFRGARIMAELAHPSVVPIREREAEDDGFFYFVMDYVSGGNLQDAVRARRVHGEQAVPIILSIGDALALAHARGHVHRDVKPVNILISESGEPCLTDFDLVTAPDTTGGTDDGALGTFLYAAPEMMMRPQDADARADVYGLGMTVAFMLHGDKLPLDALTDREPFIEELRCASAVKTILKRATAKTPQDRHPSVAAFCEALRRVTSNSGADGIAGESFVEPITGMRFLWVPGGMFLMGANDLGDECKPLHQVQVSPFWLAETPVTNRQYEPFLATQRGFKEPHFWRDRRYNQPEQPVLGVSWLEARAFCRWLSKESGRRIVLPTEAQWEFSARGEEGRRYPWGEEKPDERRAHFGKSLKRDAPLTVGRQPAGRGPYGHLDLAGNVREWCLDAWDARAYWKRGTLTIDPQGTDAADDDPGAGRACRGGAFDSVPRYLRSAFRSWFRAGDGFLVLGFRVAALPAPR
jgi:formylglycine-generating enzyme required for sulfatase activity